MLFGLSATYAAPTINGLPPTLAVGDTVFITATGGVAPYSWSSSYPAVSVTVVNDSVAKVIVLQPSPAVSITATDALSDFISYVVNAYPYTSRIGTISFMEGDTAVVPLFYSNFHSPLSLMSADIFLPYDTTLFKFVGIDKLGTLTDGMSSASNQVLDTIKIGIAASTPIGLMTEQVFLKLKFVAKNTVVSSQSSPLQYTKFLVNETVNGSLIPGMLTLDPIPNYAPVFVQVPNDTTIKEGDVYSRTVIATDANGHTVHYFLTMNPAPGSEASLDSITGVFTFNPSMFSANNYLFEVTANDGNGLNTQYQFTVTVNNVNQDPYFTSAFPDSFIVVEGSPFTFIADGADPDLAPVHFVLNGAPSGMTVDSVTGDINWTPSFTQAGSYQFDLEVHDVSEMSVPQLLKFFVVDSNQVPQFVTVPNDTTIYETVPYTALITAGDADGDAVRYFVQGGAPAGFALDSMSGVITYTPAQYDSGLYIIDLVATDHRAFGDIAYQFQLQVNNLNQAPVLVPGYPDTVYIVENQVFSLPFSGSDADGDSFHFSLFNQPSGMTIAPVSGLLEWTPDFTQAGFYTVFVTVTDTLGAFTNDSLIFAVFNTNRDPLITSGVPDTTFIMEGQTLSFDVDATDPDSDPLHYTINFTPTGMTFDTALGLVEWTPDFWQNGYYSIVYSVYDSNGASDFRQTIIAVLDSNRAPVFTAVPNDTTVVEGALYFAGISANDPDSDPVKFYVQSGQPAGLLLDSISGAITWTPDNTQQGTYPVTIVATDHRPQGSVTHSFTITVSNVNLAPVITTPLPDTLYIVEAQNMTFGLTATDADGGPIKYYVFNPPPGMTVDSVSGIFDWTPDYSQAGSYNPVFKAKDSLGAYDSKSVIFIVLNMNRLPVFTSVLNDTTISENQFLQFNYAASDPDLDSMSFMFFKPVPGMNISPAGLLEWTPSFVQAGAETVIVMVTDYSSVVLDTAVITVLNSNNPPGFMAMLKDTVIARFDTLRYQYQGFDPDAQPFFFTLLNNPPGATISDSGYFEWIPESNANGPYMFVVEISDSTLSMRDTLFVHVNRLGDVSGNGTISSFDAGLILRDQVGAITLSPFQARIGNVSGDSTISSSDASYILQYVVGLINTFPNGLEKRTGADAVMSAFAFKVVPSKNDGEYDLIVSVNKPSNVYGITMSLGFDSTVVLAKSLNTSVLTDSMMVSTFFPKQRANLALAGTKPLNTAGEIARLTFELRRKSVAGTTVLFTMKKFVLNEKDYANDIPAITLDVKPSASLPTIFALEQNYPNPFNPATTINYQLPNQSRVTITVFNMLGQEVRRLVDAEQEAGYHSVVWNGMDERQSMVSSGVYLYKITAQSNGKTLFVSTRKMLFLK